MTIIDRSSGRCKGESPRRKARLDKSRRPWTLRPWRAWRIAATICHWGFHGWAIYAVAALAPAFAACNLRLPMSLRSAFCPLPGDRVWSWFGHLVDIRAVFATIFGLATSLGAARRRVSNR